MTIITTIIIIVITTTTIRLIRIIIIINKQKTQYVKYIYVREDLIITPRTLLLFVSIDKKQKQHCLGFYQCFERNTFVFLNTKLVNILPFKNYRTLKKMEVKLNIQRLVPWWIIVMEQSGKLFSIFNDFSNKAKKKLDGLNSLSLTKQTHETRKDFSLWGGLVNTSYYPNKLSVIP